MKIKYKFFWKAIGRILSHFFICRFSWHKRQTLMDVQFWVPDAFSFPQLITPDTRSRTLHLKCLRRISDRVLTKVRQVFRTGHARASVGWKASWRVFSEQLDSDKRRSSVAHFTPSKEVSSITPPCLEIFWILDYATTNRPNRPTTWLQYRFNHDNKG